MSIRKYKADQIVTLLRQIEVAMANGKKDPTGTARTCRRKYNTLRTRLSPWTQISYRSTAGCRNLKSVELFEKPSQV